jgi:REP element-mobilizing transposase RayT
MAGSQSALTPDERSAVLEVIRRAPKYGGSIHTAVVMDDHVHVLFTPGPGIRALRFVQAWKSASAHRITKSSPRTAPIWQAEYYLRWLNGPEAVSRCASYIRANPERRWPGIEGYPWLL